VTWNWINSGEGGAFVNATNLVYTAISSYSNQQSKTLTLRDSYPYVDTDIESPMISYEFEAAFEDPMEIGSDKIVYSVNFLIDTVGRTHAERDELNAIVWAGLETGPGGISGIGPMQLESLDIIHNYEVERTPRNYKATTIRARFSLEDHEL